MIDVSLSAALGFGFGDAVYDWPFDTGYNAVTWPTDIVGVIEDFNKIHTDIEETLADLDIEPDTYNGLVLVEDFNVMEISVGVEATPIENLTIGNDFSYTSDGMGLPGAGDIADKDDGPWVSDLMAFAADTGLWLDKIENVTSVEYGLDVAGSVAATLFGEFTYTSWNYAGEEATYPAGWDGDLPGYRIWDSEETSKATFDYEVGVKVSVDF
jgi:hypothetical protein